MNEGGGDEVQRRATVLMVLATLVIFGLVAQLGNLQFLQQSVLQRRAETQRTRELPVLAPRGVIFDRQGRPVATNRAANVLFLQFPQYKDPKILERLSQILAVPLAELDERVQRRLREEAQWGPRYYEPVRLRDDITVQQHARILEHMDELPGVILDVQPIREYPFGDVGAHILGYMGPISPDELLKRQAQSYGSSDTVGKSGLEAQYEDQLHGKQGVKSIEIDFGSKPIREPGSLRDPVPGNSLVLTIDWELQRKAERALDWGMFRLQNVPHPVDRRAYPKAKAGAVVALDVRTGAVRAMVSRPGFDPNRFDQDYQRLAEDSNSPLWNRAISGTYHPGSTWKMMTGGAALSLGVVGPQETVFCPGKYSLTGQSCWVETGHGSVNVVTALRDSCDVFFYEMGRRVGIDRLVEWSLSFGFGLPTGIDLPGEEKGFLPDAAYRDREADRGRPWTLGSTTSSAIGQIIEVTPLQLAQYVATIANQGLKMRPYLVEAIVNAEGETVRRMQPEEVGLLPMRAEDLELLVRGMELVNLPGGTSDFAIWPLSGVPSAGKTGTAENPPHDDYGVFVGFVPAKNPELAIAVLVEQSGHGSAVSPIARTVFADLLGVPLKEQDPAFVPRDYPAKSQEILEVLKRGRVWGLADR